MGQVVGSLRALAGGWRVSAGRAAVITVALAAGAGPIHAQLGPASPFLPQDHWVHDAVRRADGGELARLVLAGRRTLTWCDAARALAAAAASGGHGADPAGFALERFREEFGLRDPEGCGLATLHASGLAGVQQRAGGLLTGSGYGRDDIPRLPPPPAAEISALALSGRVAAAAGPRLAGLFEAGHLDGDWIMESLQAVVAVGPVLVWGGRRPLGLGPGEGGGLIFGDEARVDGGGVQLALPLIGPGFLRHLGPFHFETLLARAGATGTVREPWLWAARGSLSPHPRLVVGINRGAIFGGENVETSLRDLVYLMIGKHGSSGSALENQIVSVDAVYRPPLPIPLEAYLEWGFEDSAGAWRDTPGVVRGVAFSDLPGMAGARVGIEHTDFARSCCGNPIWYRHMFLLAGWTQEGRPLGHPLGGHGEEWLVHGSTGLLAQRLQVNASLALRDRGSENLYAPERLGTSQAGRIRMFYQAGRWQAGMELFSEAADGWGETLLEATARVRF